MRQRGKRLHAAGICDCCDAPPELEDEREEIIERILKESEVMTINGITRAEAERAADEVLRRRA